MQIRIRTKFLLFLTLSLVVGGCQPKTWQSASYTHDADTEKLLEAEGDFALVEEAAAGEAAMDPLEAHIRARKAVNPTQMTQSAGTSKTSVAALEEKVHTRVLHIEGDATKIASRMKPGKGVMISSDNLPVAEADIRSQQQEIALAHKQQYSKPPPVPARKENIPQTEIEPASGGGNKNITSGASVVNLRMGEHPGKTRLVLDLTGPAAFSYSLDNKKQILFVELPQSDWNAMSEKILNNHPLIEAYLAKGTRGGAQLAIKLKKPSKLVFSTAMKPNEVYGDRIVLDIAAL